VSSGGGGAPDGGNAFAELLHELRSSLLQTAPRTRGTVLSAGCAGSWYFEWFNRCCGRPARHIGLELYQPPPAALPPGVEWLSRPASDMGPVPDASVDLVFSGQNLEHLWPEEAAGFLLESRRVLRPGGHLVLDSPNREVTSGLVWMHHEHVLEYSVDEIERLLAIAGFEVERTVGLWLCRDHATRRLLPLEPDPTAPDGTSSRRAREAFLRPRDSFVWWVEARPAARPCDESGLRQEVEAIAGRARDERLQRWQGCVGRRAGEGDGEWLEASRGEAGVLRYGPYAPLRRGRHQVSFEWRAEPTGGAAVALTFDVVEDGGRRELCRRDVLLGEIRSARPARLGLAFDLDRTTFGVEFRAISTGCAAVAVKPRLIVEEPR
jgi:SAM-dependent methyltransferase